MIIELKLKLQSRPSPNSSWQDSDFGPMAHTMAEQVLWMATFGHDHWMDHRLVVAK